VSAAFSVIMAASTRANSRPAFFHSANLSRFFDPSCIKFSAIILGKRPAGVISGVSGGSEPLKRFRKLSNPSDRIYVAPFHRFLY
jgi:hypothetical protein